MATEDEWSVKSAAMDSDGYATPPRRLEALTGHLEAFQLDSFNRAAQRASSAGKLTNLFKIKMLSKPAPQQSPIGGEGYISSGPAGVVTPSAGSCAGASGTGASPRTPPIAAAGAAAAGSHLLSADDLLTWSNEPIPTSLLKLAPENASRAVKMHAHIQRYCGDDGREARLPQAAAVEVVQKLLHQGLKRPELRDELYVQLVRQTRGNPLPHSRARAWELFTLVAAAMPPSKDFTGLISEYIHGVVRDGLAAAGCAPAPGDEAVRAAAEAMWGALKRSTKAGPRRTLPTSEEIIAALSGRRLSVLVFFLDETFEEVAYDVTTTVAEAVEQVAGVIRLSAFSTFSLFVGYKPVAGKAAAATEGGGPGDEYTVLDDNRYVADVVAELRSPKSAHEGWQARVVFRKRMFRETDEAVTEPTFVNLSYMQAQHDYLAGNYPVVRDDAAQMAALQMQAEYGPSLGSDPGAISAACERFITRQVFGTRPRDEWRADVGARYKALAEYSKDEARAQFLRILRTLPYGSSSFFTVRRIEDPIGLLPAKLMLGINKRGVHFFRPVPKEYLHSAELRDIMQFGSSSQAVFFKMRVAGVLHIFQFETRQGEDICMALQTHINDVMVKRITKAKAQADNGGGVRQSGTGAAAAAGALASKFEAHIADLSRQLADVRQVAEDATSRESEARLARDQVSAELADAREALASEAAARGALEDRLEAARAEAADARRELEAARGALSAAQSSATESASRVSGTEGRLDELCALVDARAREAEAAAARAAAAERALADAAKERDALEKRAVRLERALEEQAKELRDQLEVSQSELRTALRARDDKVAALLEELGRAEEQSEALRSELDGARGDLAELEELRELRADVERKERQQAAIIEGQDSLMDLLLPAQPRASGPRAPEVPRLEIKKDPRGLVTVQGATVVPVPSAEAALAMIDDGLARRHTAGTAMNRESSRSHLIISLVVEATNLQTQSVARGKLSFVDLAGSERVKKSGSTGENLKEAQAINKSLSALGDVISALASEQPHIPYRNHKLTMLMSDSLGGNAKTLMFVNVSPSDSNLDETQNSLTYATRVRTIKNDAKRDESSKEVLRLKRAVEYWKEQAGLATAEARAGADLREVTDRRTPGPDDDAPQPAPQSARRQGGGNGGGGGAAGSVGGGASAVWSEAEEAGDAQE
ncbi:hypothetical protein Rsub_09666 [Raphidocelis subcapitata]|uniref:Kinesin n=1 Tax=Raphidocelis subcapitata TaxID=307507 RepID=A0A2V0PFX3_9CHLO|nr:hypothetical protein Rsub_09666 [Raphidocelis subcapitata]|eukprot:GBF96810.1 hypothetical protein Rsub_09666 [Raphidocelis subcapitata]